MYLRPLFFHLVYRRQDSNPQSSVHEANHTANEIGPPMSQVLLFKKFHRILLVLLILTKNNITLYQCFQPGIRGTQKFCQFFPRFPELAKKAYG